MRLLPHPDISVDDAILLDHTFRRTVDTGVARNFDPNMGLDYYIDKGLLTYSAPKIDVEITSQVDDEWIKVAPYLVVDLTRVEPIPKEADVINVATTEVSPKSSPDWFYAIFTPQREGTFAAMRYSDYGPDAAFQSLDYTTLKPHERKTLTLTTGTLFMDQPASGTPQNLVHAGTGMWGYYYRFRVGVAYSYKRERNIKWIDDEFVTGHLGEATQEYMFKWKPGSGYTLVRQQQRAGPAPSQSTPPIIKGILSQHIAAQEAKLR